MQHMGNIFKETDINLQMTEVHKKRNPDNYIYLYFTKHLINKAYFKNV